MAAVPEALAKTLSELERERAAGLAPANIVLLAVCAPSAVLCVAALFAGYGTASWVLLLVGAAALGVWKMLRRDAARSLKRRIMPGLVAQIDPRLEYSTEGMPLHEFRSYGLFDPPDRYESQDLVAGVAGKTPIRFAMVHAEKRHGRDNDPTYSDLFEGLLFVAQFNKRLRSTTRVATGEADFLDESSDEHIELEDPRFNELYHVTSTDPVEARYVLTPDMMERLVALAREFDDINVAFFDDKMALALSADYGLLDPDLGARIDLAQLKTMLEKLKIIVGIVETLDLNTRIWTVK